MMKKKIYSMCLFALLAASAGAQNADYAFNDNTRSQGSYSIFVSPANPNNGNSISKNTKTHSKNAKTVYQFTVKDMNGKPVSLKKYANKVILIVNTATKCGFTPTYTDLENLYEKYHSQGFEILDFPCNQFAQQAPGTIESIHQFCQLNYGIKFPQFQKIKVNGDDAEPLYKFLKSQKGFAGWDITNPIYPNLNKMLSEKDPDYESNPDIKWNFTKFLINKKGQVVERFEPTEKIEHIDAEVAKLLKE